MQIKRLQQPWRPLVAMAVSGFLLASCGGGASGDERPVSYGAYVQSHPVSLNSTSGPETAATASGNPQVAQRSRQWAVGALASVSEDLLQANAAVIPPLHFGKVQAVASAARGDTLAALQAAEPQAGNEAWEAALMQGLERTLWAAPQALVTAGFMRSITAEGQPGTWAAFNQNLFHANALVDSPNLRMVVSDKVSKRWSWPQATAFRGLFVDAHGVKQNVPLVRVAGAVVRHTADRFDAAGLALAGGWWLIQVTPKGPLSSWGSTQLNQALAEAHDFIANRPASAALASELILPVISDFQSRGVNDTNGMDLAMNPVRADLRGLDGGGTYASFGETSDKTALAVSVDSLRYWGYATTEFIYSSRNIYGSGLSLTSFSLQLEAPVACGSEADLRPGYLVIMEPNGNIQLLARASQLEGTICY